MKTPLGIELAIDQEWQECDPRFVRIVRVVGWNPSEGKVQLFRAGRYTWAKLSRFNGKRSGYKPVEREEK